MAACCVDATIVSGSLPGYGLRLVKGAIESRRSEFWPVTSTEDGKLPKGMLNSRVDLSRLVVKSRKVLIACQSLDGQPWFVTDGSDTLQPTGILDPLVLGAS